MYFGYQEGFKDLNAQLKLTLDNRYFDMARKLSYKSDFRVKIGAVIVNRKRVVGLGWNKGKTHPEISVGNHRGLHAELDAIVGEDRHLLRGAVIYIYRELLANQGVGLCKPCPACQAILRAAGVIIAYYTDPGARGGVAEMKL